MGVSSDGIRNQLMAELRAKNPAISDQQAFDRTGKSARGAYTGQVKRLLGSKFPPGPRHLLYLDKNHPPNAVGRVTKQLPLRRLREDMEIQVVAVIPKCFNS